MSEVTVRLPSPLRPAAGGTGEMTLVAGTIGDALRQIADRLPSVRRQILRVDGRLRESAVVFLNGRQVAGPSLEATALQDRDVLELVPAVAGGTRDADSPTDSTLSAAPTFTPDEIRRYSRHLLLPEVGAEGQRRLRDSKVLLVGAGGLGAPAALYLAAAGVGTIGLAEFDRVDLSNLQRQVLYTTEDVGHPKVERAAARLASLNPEVTVRTHPTPLDASNALGVVKEYDVVIDGSDNFPTRYLVNDACALTGRPDVFGSVYRFEGQLTVLDAAKGPCYRCLFPEPPPPGFVPSCAEGGVLGVLPGVIGELQATEALKLVLGIGSSLVGRLLLYDALDLRFRELEVRRDPACVLTGDRPTQRGLIDYPAFCGTSAAGEAELTGIPLVSARALADELRSADPPLLIDVRQPGEWALGHLPGAVLIPRADLPERVGELVRARSVVLYCSGTGRSAQALRLLRELGVERVRSLEGGVGAWARDIDPTLPVY